MARSDLLVELIRSGSRKDYSDFMTTAENIIAEERAKKHHVLADRLAESIKSNFKHPTSKKPTENSSGLFFEYTPEIALSDLYLSELTQTSCEELIEEQHRADLLRSYGLEPRHKLLFAGPPGNGKTSLAEAVAHELMYPLVVIRYEAVIGSFLGETASRLQKIFDYVKTRHCVLFFDEFDTLGKERGDEHETGEIKRVVSSLLLQMDALPSYVVVIAASNHPELLDRAVWRRFDLRLELPKPSNKQIEHFITRYFESSNLKAGYTAATLAKKLANTSYSDLELFCETVLRQAILKTSLDNAKNIINRQLKNWNARLAPRNSDSVNA